MQRYFSLFLAILIMLGSSGHVMAADGDQDFFQAIGKIYVVVAVIVIIFVGLSLYLFRLDRKLSKLEQSIKS